MLLFSGPLAFQLEILYERLEPGRVLEQQLAELRELRLLFAPAVQSLGPSIPKQHSAAQLEDQNSVVGSVQ